MSCMKVTDSDGISDKKESPNEGTETSSAVPLLLLLVIKKESPNEGTEKVRLEFSRALMNQFRDLHADCI